MQRPCAGAGPRPKTRGYRLRVRVLAPLYATVMMVPLWPLMPLSRLIDWLDHRALLRQREAAVFQLRPEYRRERLDVAEVERRETVQDPLGAVPDLPLGHLNVAWRALKASMEPGDELWSALAGTMTGASRTCVRATRCGVVASRRVSC